MRIKLHYYRQRADKCDSAADDAATSCTEQVLRELARCWRAMAAHVAKRRSLAPARART